VHYNCCWKESCQPYYLDDKDGKSIYRANLTFGAIGVSQEPFQELNALCRNHPQLQLDLSKQFTDIALAK
jgi:hypothetical protein